MKFNILILIFVSFYPNLLEAQGNPFVSPIREVDETGLFCGTDSKYTLTPKDLEDLIRYGEMLLHGYHKYKIDPYYPNSFICYKSTPENPFEFMSYIAIDPNNNKRIVMLDKQRKVYYEYIKITSDLWASCSVWH